MVHKQATPSQHKTAEIIQNHVISWHHPCKHVACLISSFNDTTKAIDVQVAKNKRDLEQEIVIISQLHVINVQ
jgi:hypothetical protein